MLLLTNFASYSVCYSSCVDVRSDDSKEHVCCVIIRCLHDVIHSDSTAEWTTGQFHRYLLILTVSSRTVVVFAAWFCCMLLYRKKINLMHSFTTNQPQYIHNLISVQPCNNTRSSSMVTLARPPTRSSLKITDHSFQYAAPCLWNELPTDLREPR